MSEFIAFISNVKIIKCLKGGVPDMSGSSGENLFPSVDVFVSGSLLRIFADLPGVAPRDVSIYIYEGYIVIEGVKDIKPLGNDYRFLRLERERTGFRRIFKLPFEVTRYDAALTDGVLMIALAGDEE